MKRVVAVLVIPRDDAILVDTYRLGIARSRRIERRERSVGSPHEAMRIAAGILVSPGDPTAGVDAAGESLHRFRHIERRDRPVDGPEEAVASIAVRVIARDLAVDDAVGESARRSRDG